MLHLKGKLWKRCYHAGHCPYKQVSSRAELAFRGGGTVERVDRSTVKFVEVSSLKRGVFSTRAQKGYVREYRIVMEPINRR